MLQIPISVLELATVNIDDSFKTAIDNSMKIAVLADELNFKRIWFAEHHNMPNIASSATALLIQLAATKTQKIRVGSGGIMLPNHPPLVIAEQFGTLETLYPNRIDLGLGRAPGTDPITMQALRRDHIQNAQNFPQEIRELQDYFSKNQPDAKVNAYPGKGLQIPFYILGSSTSSAYLAAEMGLPYAFATHFAPAQFEAAAEIYKTNFKASEQLNSPYLIACVNVIAAETNERAHYLSTSYFNMIVDLVTNQRKGIQPPGEISALMNHPEIRAAVDNFTACSFIGNQKTVFEKLQNFIDSFSIDEIMVTSHIYDIEEKMQSFRILSQMKDTPI